MNAGKVDFHAAIQERQRAIPAAHSGSQIYARVGDVAWADRAKGARRARLARVSKGGGGADHKHSAWIRRGDKSRLSRDCYAQILVSDDGRHWNRALEDIHTTDDHAGYRRTCNTSDSDGDRSLVG